MAFVGSIHNDAFPGWVDIDNVKVELYRNGVLELIDANYSVPSQIIGDIQVYSMNYSWIITSPASATMCYLVYTPLYPNDDIPSINGNVFTIVEVTGLEFDTIEEAIYKKMVFNNSVVSKVSEFRRLPSVFIEEAPEGVVVPYIVFSISQLSTDNLSVKSFNVYIDFFDIKRSRKNALIVSSAIENMFEQSLLTSNDYDNIRIFWESAGFVPDPDPTIVHYNMQLTARAGRKAWCEQIK